MFDLFCHAGAVVARSIDGGRVWTNPQPLNLDAIGGGGIDIFPRLVTDQAGVWISAWVSTEHFNGATGSDRDTHLTRFELPDCDGDGIPDDCETDGDGDGTPDDCDQPALLGDLAGEGLVNGLDLGILLSQWFVPGSADLNGDGQVNGIDLGILLANWSL